MEDPVKEGLSVYLIHIFYTFPRVHLDLKILLDVKASYTS